VVSLGGSSLDNLKFSNPGGGVSGEQGSACVMGEGGLSSGCCHAPDDSGGRPGAAIASNTSSELAASSGMTTFSNECVVLTDRLGEGSGGHEDLKFSNPGGAISVESDSASVEEENGMGIGTSNDPSAALLHADNAPGSSEVTGIASVSAAACAMPARAGR